ncbi:fimbrial protein [Citrobacter sedlakii]|uniref:fimbrial protein n=1 Tax=Citrobacter sedlakii TaxID=67826 RepID=UPI000FA0E9ED|nr:fimbrial protein [Citrobacter sedlakii]EFM0752301.1 type 1 fimbrial protein [Salmonella enterica subsp. enterica serovar Bredeney]EHS1318918.1 type 1 fimbrial protein [Salmonella enterica subsp. enterica serovar Reading]MJU56991.1 type 1 fimbrial protein [Salmonella enterica subsp. enterica serovar Montevideo]MCZ4677288.1 fimbrial protein [Citrobacter sedlakii]MDR5007345.1 fimbrial protein [Citrobacter sedlakii]
MRILNSGFYALLIAVYSAGGSVEAGIRLHGQATLYGEVLASACSIALNDRYQSVAMGELPLRDLQSGSGQTVRDLVIRLDNCLTSGQALMDRKTDPAIRVRFEGLRGSQPGLFRTLGEATGVALQLSDERREIVYPGEYLPAVYQKAYNQQVLKYRIALVPDGGVLTGGDFSAALRFTLHYE